MSCARRASGPSRGKGVGKGPALDPDPVQDERQIVEAEVTERFEGPAEDLDPAAGEELGAEPFESFRGKAPEVVVVVARGTADGTEMSTVPPGRRIRASSASTDFGSGTCSSSSSETTASTEWSASGSAVASEEKSTLDSARRSVAR